MPDLTGREIFAVGKWNGIEFNESDIDDIVENFEKLADRHKVPLKLGHNDEQPMTDGQPALGWVSRVYREGKKLLADFVDVPKVVVEAIKKKLYRSVSVELLFNVDNKGNKFDHVLDAVAILGADHPAVNTLADLDILIAKRAEFSGGHRVTFTVSEGKASQTSGEDFDMDKKEVEALIAKAVEPLEARNAKLEEENEDLHKQLKASRDAAEKREKRERQDKIKAARDEITDLLDGAVRDKRMTPAVREIYSEQIGLDDDEKVLDINVEKVKLMCGAGEAPKGRQGNSVKDDDDEYERPDQEIVRRAKKYQAEHGVKFKVALSRVTEADPTLHRAYLDSNLEG